MEYVPPPLPDRINPIAETDYLPAGAVDLEKWRDKLTNLKSNTTDESLISRIELYGARIIMELALRNAEGKQKRWHVGDIPGAIA